MTKKRILRPRKGFMLFGVLYVLGLCLREPWPLITSDPVRMRILPATGVLLATLTPLLLISSGWIFAMKAVGESMSMYIGFSIYYQTSIYRYLPGAVASARAGLSVSATGHFDG